MTDKKLKVSAAAYTELAIQIATLSMKVDKILELLNKPEVTIEPLRIKSLKDIMPEDIKKARLLFADLVPVGSSAHCSSHFDTRDPEVTELVNKAIAELSDNEKFEEFK